MVCLTSGQQKFCGVHSPLTDGHMTSGHNIRSESMTGGQVTGGHILSIVLLCYTFYASVTTSQYRRNYLRQVQGLSM